MVKKKAKGSMTIEDLAKVVRTEIGSLARSTAKEFARVHEKMDRRFAKLDSKIDDLAISTVEGFAEVHGKFDEVHERFSGVDARLDKIEAKVTFLKVDVSSLERRLNVTTVHERRLLALEKKAGMSH